jgi:Tfp pilus assembly protein PilF
VRSWAVSLLALLLAACAGAPVVPRYDAVFNDRLFSPPSERINAGDIFALNAEMQRFLNVEIAAQIASKGAREALLDAVYRERQLRIEYDSVMTRNAAEAFAARSGNCLSLVIMTAAFAKALGLPVQFQTVRVEDIVSRSDNIYFFIGHVNLTLGTGRAIVDFRRNEPDLLTVDFLPPQQMIGLRTRPISENTVVAMYMNNRAAEAFARRQVDDAYWWARAAVEQDRDFMSSYNTLGVIYRRHGNSAEAERVLAYALERDPKNVHVMSNLVSVLNDVGKVAEAESLKRRLEQAEPNPMFSYFDRGMKAMRDGKFAVARDLFAKEVDRAPYYHEFRFWLANAYAGLGDIDRARRELALALEFSTTRHDHDMYAAKLDRIRASVH